MGTDPATLADTGVAGISHRETLVYPSVAVVVAVVAVLWLVFEPLVGLAVAIVVPPVTDLFFGLRLVRKLGVGKRVEVVEVPVEAPSHGDESRLVIDSLADTIFIHVQERLFSQRAIWVSAHEGQTSYGPDDGFHEPVEVEVHPVEDFVWNIPCTFMIEVASTIAVQHRTADHEVLVSVTVDVAREEAAPRVHRLEVEGRADDVFAHHFFLQDRLDDAELGIGLDDHPRPILGSDDLDLGFFRVTFSVIEDVIDAPAVVDAHSELSRFGVL